MEIIGERIRELRMMTKLTQKQLAESIGVKPVSLQRFEYGTVRPSLDTLILLADHFGVSLDYLVGRSNDPLRVEAYKALIDAGSDFDA